MLGLKAAEASTLVAVGFIPEVVAGYVTGDALPIKLQAVRCCFHPAAGISIKRSLLSIRCVQEEVGDRASPCGAGKTIVGWRRLAAVKVPSSLTTSLTSSCGNGGRELLDKTVCQKRRSPDTVAKPPRSHSLHLSNSCLSP